MNFSKILEARGICMDLCSALLIHSATHCHGAQVWHMLMRGHVVLPAAYSFIHKWNGSYPPLLSSHRAYHTYGEYLRRVLISHLAESSDRVLLAWVTVYIPSCLPARRWLSIPRLAGLIIRNFVDAPNAVSTMPNCHFSEILGRDRFGNKKQVD